MPLTRICLKFSYTYPPSHTVFFYSIIFRSRYGPTGWEPLKTLMKMPSVPVHPLVHVFSVLLQVIDSSDVVIQVGNFINKAAQESDSNYLCWPILY